MAYGILYVNLKWCRQSFKDMENVHSRKDLRWFRRSRSPKRYHKESKRRKKNINGSIKQSRIRLRMHLLAMRGPQIWLLAFYPQTEKKIWVVSPFGIHNIRTCPCLGEMQYSTLNCLASLHGKDCKILNGGFPRLLLTARLIKVRKIAAANSVLLQANRWSCTFFVFCTSNLLQKYDLEKEEDWNILQLLFSQIIYLSYFWYI